MEIHPALRVLSLQHPQAEIRHKGTQLFWVDYESGRENSITFFEDHELPEMKKMAWGMNDVFFSGNLRFSSTI